MHDKVFITCSRSIQAINFLHHFFLLEFALIKKIPLNIPSKKIYLPMKKNPARFSGLDSQSRVSLQQLLSITTFITWYIRVLMIPYFVMMMRWEHLDFNDHFYSKAPIRGKQEILYHFKEKLYLSFLDNKHFNNLPFYH